MMPDANDSPPKVLCLKGRGVAIANIGSENNVREVHRLNAREVRMSAIALARAANSFVFADLNTLFRVSFEGEVVPIIDVDRLTTDRELNWEIATDDTLETIYVTDVGSPRPNRRLRILEIANTRVSELDVPFPHGAAYKIDPKRRRVAMLVDQKERQNVCVYGWDGLVEEFPLAQRYDFIELSPEGDAVVLSSLQTGPIAILTLRDVGRMEVVVPARGAAAGWVTSNQIAYYSGDRQLICRALTENGSEEILFRSTVPILRQLQPPHCDDGTLLWLPEPQGAIAFDIASKQTQVVPGKWTHARAARRTS